MNDYLLFASIFGVFLPVKLCCEVGLLIHRLGTTTIDAIVNENFGL